MPRTYYNEIDKQTCAWLRELMKAGLIPEGDIDERSIVDVRGDDVRGYDHCHWFSGIGGWPYALRLAQWPDDEPVWTGSCPCQPFSAAGKQQGKEDSRNLWPAFCRLISECRPLRVFGEQVSGAVGFGWIDRVRSDMEKEAYSLGVCVLGAHSVGAPHIRQRLYWVADAKCSGESKGPQRWSIEPEVLAAPKWVTGACVVGPGRDELYWMADSDRNRQSTGRRNHAEVRGLQEAECEPEHSPVVSGRSCGNGGLAHSDGQRRTKRQDVHLRSGRSRKAAIDEPGNDFWDRYELIPCLDGKARRIEPSTFPLVNGLPKGMVRVCDQSAPLNAQSTAEARIMRLRGYGNAIVPQVAAEFIRAFRDLRRKGIYT